MSVSWPIRRGKGSDTAPQGDGMRLPMTEELPGGRTVNVDEFFFVTLSPGYTNRSTRQWK
ncbi:N-ethylammeline chlorohydrolase [Corchorus olitorius]|uniref:N-ethylammeline chlorohydrolase n=1 Tax=Corchorus olitorius TaxID=93759 RepID=A0A1R3FZH8_9ROSI|nr:N-ethylammeline chlorohydrolase [Corchorus olitorius]